MTDAEFKALLDACPFGNPNTASDLVTKRYTNMKFNEKVNERHFSCCESYSYFTDFFPVETWADGQGQDMITEEYYHPRINYSFNYFARTMQVCDPNDADECDTVYCDIPEGGYGNLPGPEMYRWGFKSKPMCVANIRHLRDFKAWAKRLIDVRFAIDEQVMQMFYTFMAIRTTGHKLVLEGTPDANGDLQPTVSSNPRNPLGGFNYNYMDVMFPALNEPDNLLPLSLDILELLARRWETFCRNGNVGEGPRGEKIWEFWHPEDWYKQEAIDNPDYMEKLKLTMPEMMFAGYRNNGRKKDREVIGNWAMKSVPCLPRFDMSCEGGVIPLDMHEDVPVEIGNEPVEGRQWLNAPILMAISPSPQQGKILRRPDLTESAEGFPILPIMGSGDWIIRNDYDPTCNEDLNKPHTRKRYEMGFMMTDPNAAIAMLFRAKKFRLRPTNNCDLQPIGSVVVNRPCDVAVGIGSKTNVRKADVHVTKIEYADWVECDEDLCLNDAGPTYEYRLKLTRKGQRVDFNQLDCACGSTVKLIIKDEDGVDTRVQDATVFEIVPHTISPVPYIYVNTATEVDRAVGETIKGIICEDATPGEGTVSSRTVSADEPDCPAYAGAKYILDSPLDCATGDDVTIEYFDADDVSLGSYTGTIAADVPRHLYYHVTSADPDAFTIPAGTSYTTLVCV